jgi:hypothetical protein
MDKTERTRAVMAKALARKDAKGWTYEEASIKTGIPVSTLSHWRRRLRDEPPVGQGDLPAFIELDAVALSASSDHADIELLTSSGHRVIFAPGFDEPTLRRLLDILAC